MNVKHTPGPWDAVQDPYPHSHDRWLVEIRDGRYKAFIAEVHADPDHSGGPRYQGTRKANARLIAAAPDLLAALEDCVESLTRLPDGNGAYRVTCLQQARNAIAKATFTETPQ